MDKALLQQDFNRAAQFYDEYAQLQHDVAKQLTKGLSPRGRILDVGAGTGYIASLLDQEVIQLDIAYRMCQQAQRYGAVINADMELLPLASGRFDYVLSSLALQWASNPKLLFKEMLRILRFGGKFALATFGADTLQELKIAFAECGQENRVNDFIAKDILEKYVSDIGLRVIKAESVTQIRHYKTVIELLTEIRGVGGSNKAISRHEKMLSREDLRLLEQAYRKGNGGQVTASWEIIYLTGSK